MGEFDPYIAAWRERWKRERERDREATSAARGIADRLARILKTRFDVRRVILTGSLARGEFRQGSDIDLAVEGLAAGDLFRAGAALERDADGIDVDLVPLESATPAYLEWLERDGIVLAEPDRD